MSGQDEDDELTQPPDPPAAAPNPPASLTPVRPSWARTSNPSVAAEPPLQPRLPDPPPVPAPVPVPPSLRRRRPQHRAPNVAREIIEPEPPTPRAWGPLAPPSTRPGDAEDTTPSLTLPTEAPLADPLPRVHVSEAEPSEPRPWRRLGLSQGLPGWAGPLITLAIGGLLLLGLYELYRGLGEILTVLLLAMLIAYLLDPLIDRFEARGWDRSVAIGTSMVVGLAGAVTLLLLVVPYVVEESTGIGDRLDSYVADLGPKVRALEGWIEVRSGKRVDLGLSALADRVPDLVKKIQPTALDPVGDVIKRLLGSTFGVIGALLRWSLLPLFTFFFLRDFDRIRLGALSLVPPRMRPSVEHHAREIDLRMAMFVRGQVLVCLALAVLYATGLAVFTHIDMAVLIGGAAGILFIIPYFGTILGIVAGTTVALLQFGFTSEVLKVWAVFGVVQFIEGALLTPKIVGDSVGLHPVVVMLALVVGGNLFEFLGILLAVPVAAALQVLLVSFVTRYRESPWFLDHPSQPGA